MIADSPTLTDTLGSAMYVLINDIGALEQPQPRKDGTIPKAAMDRYLITVGRRTMAVMTAVDEILKRGGDTDADAERSEAVGIH